MLELRMFVFSFVLVVITNIASGRLLMTPVKEVTVNRTARHVFECSTDTGSIQWKHKHLGAIRPAMVYDGSKLFNGYADSGRFSVFIDAQTGQYNLVISSVELDDAGEFYCIDDNGRGEQAVSIFHVLENLPELLMSPSDVYEMVGQTVRLHCSTTYSSTPVYWKHRPVGSNEIHTVYYGEHGLQNGYRRNRRFSVVGNEDEGVYDLQITSLSSSDAGTYTCIDNSGLGKSASAELMIINSNPSCESDVDSDGVLFENTCGLGPDNVGLSCSVGYIGNQAPKLVWKNEHHKVQHSAFSSSPNVISGRINVAARKDTKWSSYVCQVGGYSCTPTIDKFIYTLETRSSKSIDRSEQIKCYINSTLPCSYEWSRTDEFGSEIVSFKQIYRPPYPGSYLCTAKCDIRGKPCRIDVLNVDFSKEDENRYEVERLQHSISALGVLLVLILAALAILCVYLLWKRYQSKKYSPIYVIQSLPVLSDLDRVVSFDFCNGKLFVICKNSAKVFVYEGCYPYKFQTAIDIRKMKNPRDIAVSNTLGLVFVNDCDVKGTIYKAHIPSCRMMTLLKKTTRPEAIMENLERPYAFSITTDGRRILIGRQKTMEFFSEKGETLEIIEFPKGNGISSFPKQIIDRGTKYLITIDSDIREYSYDLQSCYQKFTVLDSETNSAETSAHPLVRMASNGEIFVLEIISGKIKQLHTNPDGNYEGNFQEVATLKKDDFADKFCLDENGGKLLAIASCGDIHEIYFGKDTFRKSRSFPRDEEKLIGTK